MEGTSGAAGQTGTRGGLAKQALHWSAAAALMSLLTSCTVGSINGRQLGTGTDSSAVCALQPEHGMAAYGHVVQNEGDFPLVLKSVSLVDAENLKIYSAHVMPIQGSSPYVIGVGSTEPEEPEARAAWREAKDVESYKIEPGDSVNVVVALDNGAQPSGTARALRIDYGQGAVTFFTETNMTLTLVDDSCPMRAT